MTFWYAEKPVRGFSSVELNLMLVLEFRFKLSLLKVSGNKVCLLDRDTVFKRRHEVISAKAELLMCIPYFLRLFSF